MLFLYMCARLYYTVDICFRFFFFFFSSRRRHTRCALVTGVQTCALPIWQAKMAEPMEIAFFQNFFVAAILALGAPWFLAVPDAGQTPNIVGAAILATSSLLLLSWAYARAETQILPTPEYTGFLWAMLFGWYFHGQPVTPPPFHGRQLNI